MVIRLDLLLLNSIPIAMALEGPRAAKVQEGSHRGMTKDLSGSLIQQPVRVI